MSVGPLSRVAATGLLRKRTRLCSQPRHHTKAVSRGHAAPLQPAAQWGRLSPPVLPASPGHAHRAQGPASVDPCLRLSFLLSPDLGTTPQPSFVLIDLAIFRRKQKLLYWTSLSSESPRLTKSWRDSGRASSNRWRGAARPHGAARMRGVPEEARGWLVGGCRASAGIVAASPLSLKSDCCNSVWQRNTNFVSSHIGF